MRPYILILSLLIVLSSPCNATAQVEFPSTEAFLKSILEERSDLRAEARGDLNGDGLPDWAGVVRRKGNGSFSGTYQLYVLLRQRGGGYRVAETSIEADIPGAGCCWLDDLRISRSSVYIHHTEKGVEAMEAATHAFKLHRGQWRLVGVRLHNIEHKSRLSFDTDVNLLTGLVIDKEQKRNGKQLTTRRNIKFAVSLLKAYDFSNSFGIAELGERW